jgi:CubicO group peptidase (beta-lactamase class C family)
MTRPVETDQVGGFVVSGYEAVAEAFAENFDEREEIGAAFAAFVDGRCVIDLWGGIADRSQALSWNRDTLSCIFSGTKGLVATCLLILIERGHLSLDEPVCRYWPEFAAHGKEHVLVRHAVSHTAGLPGLSTPVSSSDVTDSLRMACLLADQRPITEPGQAPCYHAFTWGWLCGELIRRVSGRSVGAFFRDEIAEPLALETWISLPAEHESRVAKLERPRGVPGGSAAQELRRDEDHIRWSIWENPPRYSEDPMPANTRAWHAAEIPATSGISTARSLARMYGCLANGGRIERVRLMSPVTLNLAVAPLSVGHDPYLDAPIAFSVGYQIQTSTNVLGPVDRAFGHGGAGGSVHGAWPDVATGFSYTLNGLGSVGGTDPRAAALLEALHDSVNAQERGIR